MSGSSVQQRKVPVWDNRIQLNFQIRGQGPALLFLHPAAGFAWDPFLERLAEDHTVYAPEFPGTTPGDPYAIHQIDDLFDAILLYEEALRALDLQGVPAIGASFGGMMALELGSVYPSLFSKIVLLDPAGLWRDDAPVRNWMEATPEQLAGLLFKNPASPAAQAMLAMPSDPEMALKATAQFIWNLGATGKMVWPIPERGLVKRLHRVAAPTLIVWGENDALIPSVYAQDFAARIRGSRVELIAECGHVPQVEQADVTYRLVTDFLGERRMAA